MKINENKDNLPITYLTTLVSRGWEEVGMLREEIEAVKKEFKNTGAIEECVNNLIDAYLICIGTVEGILDNKKYVKFPEEASALKEAVEEIKPEMEAIDVIKNQVELQVEDDEVSLVNKGAEDADKLVLDVSDEEHEILESEFEDNEDFEYIADDEVEKNNKSSDNKEKEFEPFEYFCDFE